MHVFGSNVEKFFGQKGHFFFEGLYQSVNRQALAPFFRQAVFWGLFPHFINDARFIDIEELAKLNI